MFTEDAFTEDAISPDYLLKPGDRIYSRGKIFQYEVVSNPLCRLYWQNIHDESLSKAKSKALKKKAKVLDDGSVCEWVLEPWVSESSWKNYKSCKVSDRSTHNWTKQLPGNYPSYLVKGVGLDSEFYLTLSWRAEKC